MSIKIILLVLPLVIFVASVTVSPPALDINSLIKLELAKHNAYRVWHGVPALTLNDTLNSIAQNYSKVIFDKHSLVHSTNASNGVYGQNLFYSWAYPTLNYLGGDASTSWYSENLNYDYTTGKSINGKVTGHFTAMVWKSVQSVGFGFYQGAQSGGYAIYVVANYYPTPNVVGQYITNVLKPK